MPYFIEYIDDRIEKKDGELNPEELGADVRAAYTVAQVFEKQSVFKAKNLVPKIIRRIKLPSGEMKLKEDLTPAELEWYLAKRKAQLAKNRAKKQPQIS